MAIDAAQLRVLFTSDGADRVKGDIQGVGKAVDGAGSGFDRLRNTALGFGTALIAPMGLGLRAAVDLEQGIANVNAALGGLDAGTLDKLTSSIQEIGAASQYSATEVAVVADALAKAGYDAEQLTDGMLQSVVDLSQATGDGLAPSVEAVVAAMSTWKEGIVDTNIALTDATRVADILTVAANESSAGLTDITAGMRQLGPIAAQMGISYEEAAAAIALFTNNGLKGADAGVSLTRGLQNLADPTSEATEWMNQLGIAAFDMEGNFVGFPELFRQLQTGMAGLDDQTKLTALSTIFGAEAMDVMGLAIMNGADPLETMIALMGESGAAADQSAMRMNTLKAQFGELTEGVTTFLGSLLQGLLPGFRWTVDGANALLDVLMRIPAPIKTIIGTIAGSLAAFAAITRSIQAFQAFDMLLGGGTAKAFRVPLGPIAALTAAGGALYLGWRSNFLGLRDTLMDFGRAAWDTFNDVATVVVHFGRVWRGAFGAFRDDGDNLLAAGLRAMGVGLEQVSRFSPRFGASIRNVSGWMMNAADDVNTLTYNFRQFRDAGVDPVSSALMSLGTVFPRLTSVLRPVTEEINRFFTMFTLGRVLEDISGGNWIESIIAGIQVGLGALQQTAFRLGSWVLDVGVPAVTGWIVDAAANVWDALKTAAGWAWDGLAAIGAWTLETAVPTVTGWISDAAGGVWEALKTAAGWTWDQVAPLGTITVEIAGWLINAAQDLWERVKAFVRGGSAGFGESQGMGGASTSFAKEPIHIGNIPISLGGFDFTIDGPGMWEAFNNWFDEQTTVTPEMITNAEMKGREIGEKTWEAIKSGIRGIFGGGGMMVESQGLGGGGGVVGMSDVVTGFLGNFFQGLGEAILADLQTWIDGIKEDIRQKWNDFWDGILPDVSIDMPDIDWPDMPSPPDWISSPPAWLAALARGDVMGAITSIGGGGGGSSPDGSGGGGRGFGGTSNIDGGSGGANPNGADRAQFGGFDAFAAGAALARQAVLDELLGMQSDVASGLSSVSSAFTTGMLQVQTTVASGMASTASAFTTGMAQSSASVTSGMATSVAAVSSGMGAMVGAVAGGVAAIVGSIAGGMAAATGAVASNAARWPGIIASQAGAMSGAGFAVGSAAGMGVAAGLNSTLGAVSAAAARIVATVNGAMIAAARIASPSKMTAEIGRYMAEGVAVGLGDMTALRHVAAAANDVVGMAAVAMSTSPPAYAVQGNASTRGGGGTYAPVINNYITPGPGMDEEALAESVMRKMAPALEAAERRHARAMGGV